MDAHTDLFLDAYSRISRESEVFLPSELVISSAMALLKTQHTPALRHSNGPTQCSKLPLAIQAIFKDLDIKLIMTLFCYTSHSPLIGYCIQEPHCRTLLDWRGHWGLCSGGPRLPGRGGPCSSAGADCGGIRSDAVPWHAVCHAGGCSPAARPPQLAVYGGSSHCSCHRAGK